MLENRPMNTKGRGSRLPRKPRERGTGEGATPHNQKVEFLTELEIP